MSDEYNIVKDNLNFYRTSQPLSVNPNAKNNYLKILMFFMVRFMQSKILASR